MKIHSVEQNTPQWKALRLGIPTASEFDNIVTPTGKLSSQADKYMYRLLGEWILGEQEDSPSNQFMDHGHEYEEQAAASFAFETGLDTEKVGFITTDDGMVGASPDRLVKGHKRGVELKCPFYPHIHLGYLLSRGVDDKYKPQVQGQIYVCEFEMSYIQSYYPALPAVVLEVQRDDGYIALLKTALDQFVDKMLTARMDLEQRFGPFVRPEPQPKPEPQQRRTAEENAAWYAHLKSVGVSVGQRKDGTFAVPRG